MTKIQRRMIDKRVVALGTLVNEIRGCVDSLGDPKRGITAISTACILLGTLQRASTLATQVHAVYVDSYFDSMTTKQAAKKR